MGTWRPVCTYSFWSLKVLFLHLLKPPMAFVRHGRGRKISFLIYLAINFFLLSSWIGPSFRNKEKRKYTSWAPPSLFLLPHSPHVCFAKKKQEIVPTFGRRLNSIHPTTTMVSPGKLWSLCQRERPRARWKKEKKRKYEVEPLADLKYFKAGEAKGNFVTGGGWARP